MTVVDALSLAALALAAGAAGVRWLRVAQREHYLAGAAIRFATRWWRATPLNLVLAALAAAACIVSFLLPAAGLVEAVVLLGAPVGLGLRGRTSKLAWTRRLRTVAAVAAVLAGVVVAAGALAGGLRGAVGAAAVAALGVPVLVDLALLATTPLEDALARRYVKAAVERLARVRPEVVAVTGSYGKTTTKGYIAHLASARFETLASPASYNNRAGLARTVNEHLAPGTELLIAEMGTYGPGEIAEMCSWLRPRTSVITAIGPAHLERFRSLDRTLEAKAEIAAGADVVVLNVDDERLAGLAGRLRAGGKQVVGASGRDRSADVAVLASDEGLELRVDGESVGTVALGEGERPTALSNAACAAAVALRLGVAPEVVVARLASLPVPPNRLERYLADGGYVVLDDTFNSNPAGARFALGRLAAESPAGRRVLVTPGMVELGPTQRSENAALAEEAAAAATDLVVVARTNRRALLEGARRVPPPAAEVRSFGRLEEAVAWVRASLGPGDAVLYENDLPDHFP